MAITRTCDICNRPLAQYASNAPIPAPEKKDITLTKQVHQSPITDEKVCGMPRKMIVTISAKLYVGNSSSGDICEQCIKDTVMSSLIETKQPVPDILYDEEAVAYALNELEDSEVDYML